MRRGVHRSGLVGLDSQENRFRPSGTFRRMNPDVPLVLARRRSASGGLGTCDDHADPSEMSLSHDLALPEESARYFVVAHAGMGRGNRLWPASEDLP
jgi:hypothetical protein